MHSNFKSSPVPKSSGGGSGGTGPGHSGMCSGGSTSETEESGGGGGRRDSSPLSIGASSGVLGGSCGPLALNQSLSIKQELIDAQQQQQQRDHHSSLPPDYLPVSTDQYSFLFTIVLLVTVSSAKLLNHLKG